MKTQLIQKFATLLLPHATTPDPHTLVTDEKRKITIAELPNKNIHLSVRSLIKDKWILMTTIEIQINTRYFWSRISDALATLTGHNNMNLTQNVPTILENFPEGLYLQEEKEHPIFKIPKKKKEEAHTTGKAISKFKPIENEEPDIIDQIEEQQP